MNEHEKNDLLTEALDISQENYNRLLKDYMVLKKMAKIVYPYNKPTSLKINSYTGREAVVSALVEAGFTVSMRKKERFDCCSDYYIDIVQFPEEAEEE